MEETFSDDLSVSSEYSMETKMPCENTLDFNQSTMSQIDTDEYPKENTYQEPYLTKSEITSDRKRQRLQYDEATLDDIMLQISSKLKVGNKSPEAEQREESILALLEVLGCSREEADFYLDSSAGNIETAVVLWLENNPNSAPSLQFQNTFQEDYALSSALFATENGHFPLKLPQQRKKWQPKVLKIEGLPLGWIAKVNPNDGQVIFVNTTTGTAQRHVPAGFADEETQSSSSNTEDCHTSSTIQTSQHSSDEIDNDNEDNNNTDHPDISSSLDLNNTTDKQMDSENYGLKCHVNSFDTTFTPISQVKVFGTDSEYWRFSRTFPQSENSLFPLDELVEDPLSSHILTNHSEPEEIVDL